MCPLPYYVGMVGGGLLVFRSFCTATDTRIWQASMRLRCSIVGSYGVRSALRSTYLLGPITNLLPPSIP